MHQRTASAVLVLTVEQFAIRVLALADQQRARAGDADAGRKTAEQGADGLARAPACAAHVKLLDGNVSDVLGRF